MEKEKKGAGGIVLRWLITLAGIAVLFLLAKWQYGNILDGKYAGTIVPIIGSVVLVVAGILLLEISPNVFFTSVINLGMSAAALYFMYYCLTNSVPWYTAGGVWVMGLGWGFVMGPKINHSFLLKATVMLCLPVICLVFFGAWLQVIPYAVDAWNRNMGAGVINAVFGTIIIAIPFLAGGYLMYLLWKDNLGMYIVCYLHTGAGPKIKVGKKSYGTPKTMRWAYNAAQTNQTTDFTKYQYILYTRCADLAYEKYKTDSSPHDKKYFIAEKEYIDKFKVNVFFSFACSTYEEAGDISRARDYAEEWLEMLRFSVSCFPSDYLQAMERRQKYDDGRAVDPKAEAELMALWEKWKEDERVYRKKREQELREEKYKERLRMQQPLEPSEPDYDDDDDEDEEPEPFSPWGRAAAENSGRRSSGGASYDSGIEKEFDLNRMPSIIYDSNNNEWRKQYSNGREVVYREKESGRLVTIYSGQVSANFAQTSAGSFHWY